MEKAAEKHRILSSQEISVFCDQIAMMLDAGMALYDGMEAVAQTHSGGAQSELYLSVSRAVNETGSLSEAMKQVGVFPHYLVEMTGIGERTGRTEEVMRGLSEYYSREGRIRRAIVSAVTYPLVLSVMMALIVLIMVWKVLPLFQRVLSNMGVAMSASGSTMLSLGIGIAWGILALVLVLVVLVVGCLILLRTKKREAVLRIVQKVFPPLGRLRDMITSSRVASVMSMMIASGFPMDEALEMVPNVLDDVQARTRIQQMHEKTRSGGTFVDVLTGSGMFDELYNSMIRTGSSVGCVDQVMARVARDYEEKTEESIADLVSIIEPTLVCVLCIVIGAVLLSVMLPMAGIISSIL